MASLATRLATRELRRHRGRTLLIALLLAVPLAALGGLATATSSAPQDDAVAIASGLMGEAPAVLTPLAGADGVCTQPDLAIATCPGEPGSTESPAGQPDFTPTPLDAVTVTGSKPRTVATREATLTWRGATLASPVLVQDVTAAEESIRHDVEPRALPGAGQVLVTGEGMRRLSLAPGDTVHLDGHDYLISGRLRSATADDFGPPAWFAVGPEHPLAAGAAVQQVLLDRVPTAQQVADLNHQGVGVLSRSAVIDEQRNNPSGSPDNVLMAAMYTAGTVLVLLVTGTVAAAAFAIGFRQQARSLALLAATGARAATLRAISVRQGLTIGLVACATGTVVGALAGVGVQWWSKAHDTFYPAPLSVPVGTLVAITAVGVVAAVVAAWLPARRVALQEVVGAIRSSETAQAPARRPWVGLALAVLGLAVGVVGAIAASPQANGIRKVENGIIPAVGAVVLLFFGALFSMGWVLERLSGSLGRGPVAVRLASRDWSRNRARASAVVTATMAVTALAGTALVANASVGRTSVADWTQTEPSGFVIVTGGPSRNASIDNQVVTRIRGVLGEPRQVRTLTVPAQGEAPYVFPALYVSATCTGDGRCGASVPVVVDDGSLVEFLTGSPATPQQRAVLDEGGALVPSAFIHHNQVEIGSEQPITVAALPYGEPTMPAIIGPGFVARHGVKAPLTLTETWLDYGRRPTLEQQHTLEQVVLEYGAGETRARWDTGPVDSYAPITRWFALVLGSLLVVVSVIATSLALRDARHSSSVLAVVGASSWTLRQVTATSAAVTTAVGVAAGLLVGVVPVVLVILGTRGYVLLSIPWQYLVPLVVGVPLLLGVAGWLTPPATARAVRAD
ncbi:FtsX-like permease family protein [Aestuariimicrobium soli]|uniref:FtsX-like permease family protein n=1 Tax=Aestuariimicrobium soli TaxID=2035834 RepID=UPI003EBCDACA